MSKSIVVCVQSLFGVLVLCVATTGFSAPSGAESQYDIPTEEAPASDMSEATQASGDDSVGRGGVSKKREGFVSLVGRLNKTRGNRCGSNMKTVPQRVANSRGWCEKAARGPTICLESDAERTIQVVKHINIPEGKIKAGQRVKLVVKAPTQTRIGFVACQGDKQADQGFSYGSKSVESQDASMSGTRSTKAPVERALVRGKGGKAQSAPIQYGVVEAMVDTDNAGVLAAEIVLVNRSDEVLAGASDSIYAEPVYKGAVHIGLAIMAGSAVDMDFKSQKLPGSFQSEIVSTRAAPVDVDLTVGYSPFLDGGQRVGGCVGSECFSPYFGLGLYNPKDKSFLKSVLLGLNYTVTRDLSLSAVGVLRRVQVLSEGYYVGSAVASGADGFASETWRLGWGIVLNFSPNALKSGLASYKDSASIAPAPRVVSSKKESGDE